jgi:hypothetical protein
MSLINDALKRAKQAQQKQSPPSPTVAPLRPADPARSVHAPRALLLPIVAAALLAALALPTFLVAEGKLGFRR